MGPGCRCLAALICILGCTTAAFARTEPAGDPFLESILGLRSNGAGFDSGPDPVPRLLQQALADLDNAGDKTPPGEYAGPTEPPPSAPAVTILPPGTAGAASSEFANPNSNSLQTARDIDLARAAALREKQARQERGTAPQSTASESVNIGAVVGGILGALALVGIVVGAVVYSQKRERAHRYSRYQNEEI